MRAVQVRTRSGVSVSLSGPVRLTARGRPALYGLHNQVGGIVDEMERPVLATCTRRRPRRRVRAHLLERLPLGGVLSGRAEGRVSALRVSPSKSFFYGAFVWARRALNSKKRWFPAWAAHEKPGLIERAKAFAHKALGTDLCCRGQVMSKTPT